MFKSSVMLRRAAWYILTDLSEERSISIFRVYHILGLLYPEDGGTTRLRNFDNIDLSTRRNIPGDWILINVAGTTTNLALKMFQYNDVS
jgi:hypothetical protein